MSDDAHELPAVDDLSLADQLRAAIVDGVQLELLYQPVADARSGEIRRVEALIRWQHPAMGLLTPARFLPSPTNPACYLSSPIACSSWRSIS